MILTYSFLYHSLRCTKGTFDLPDPPTSGSPLASASTSSFAPAPTPNASRKRSASPISETEQNASKAAAVETDETVFVDEKNPFYLPDDDDSADLMET